MSPIARLTPRPAPLAARVDPRRAVPAKTNAATVATKTNAATVTTKTSAVTPRNVPPGVEAPDRLRQRQIQAQLPRPASDEETEQARLASREVLTPTAATPTPAPGDREREVVSDAPSANVLQPRADLAAVERRTTDNRAAVENALGKLPPDDQARYRELDRRLGSDPDSRLSLQTMLLERRLSGDTLRELQALDGAPKAKMVEGTRPGRLLRETLREIASPQRIEQADRGTCVPTSATIDLAQRDPAEYVRLVRGLASPEGEVTTRSGVVLKRELGTRTEDGAGRTTSQRLLEPAVMEAANGDGLDYDNKADGHWAPVLDADGQPKRDPQTGKPMVEWKGSGLGAEPTERAFEILSGTNYDQISPQVVRGPRILGRQPLDVTRGEGPLDPVDIVQKTSLEQVEEAVRAGRSVPVGIRLRRDEGPLRGGHQILVTRVYRDGGVDYVQYQNPWGSTERMRRAEFEERMMDAQVERAA